MHISHPHLPEVDVHPGWIVAPLAILLAAMLGLGAVAAFSGPVVAPSSAIAVTGDDSAAALPPALPPIDAQTPAAELSERAPTF